MKNRPHRTTPTLTLSPRPSRPALLCVLTGAIAPSFPAHAADLEEVQVTGRYINLVGRAQSASQGLVGQQEIEVRPLLRTGEVLELVPGMVVTQHSGSGKANQYFLRGFNLDHGTDFATWVDGMPVNMRTHGHGQGYTDLNFVIPETIGELEYRKGAYYADVGDFSSAGAAEMRTMNQPKHHLLELTAGEDSFTRAVAVGGTTLAGSRIVYGLELNRYDGPWTDIDEDIEKVSGLLKYTLPLAGGDLAVTAMGYDNSWNSADQIPRRAVAAGIIDELGSIDRTVGGESSRYSLSADWRNDVLHFSAYAIDYELDLFSNFTYYLDDEIEGDQFEQVDDRLILGGQASYRIGEGTGASPMSHRVGGEWRYDMIDEVALYRTRAQQRRGPVRSDEVDQWSIGLFYENEMAWTDRLRSIVGLRYDHHDFDVRSRIGENVNGVDLTTNGGGTDEDIVSLKGNLIYTLNERWEVYASAGQGFHSNDARGTTIAVDPADGAAAEPVDPLVESLGGEVGLRAFWRDRLNTSLALWYLELDSELLFVGDAGNTEPNRASERRGLEWTAYYQLTDHWTLDVEYAWTDAQFSEDAPEGDQIPGALEHVTQAGLSLDQGGGWFGSLRLRYFGERPLVEDGSVKSDSTTVVNLRAGYRWEKLTLRADLLNLLDSDDHDIDYYYASRLPGEPSGGVEDLHYHVMEPRTLRLSLSLEL